MWTAARDGATAGAPYRIRTAGSVLTCGEVVDAWCDDAEFRAWFSDTLAADDAQAFRWETPALTRETLGRAFEFVLVDSPELDRVPDPEPFERHFARAVDDVVSFANLGGDARLVVPTPVASAEAYGHLAAFVRGAPPSQQDALWRLVGQQMRQRLDARPVWLNTAGAGVPWLHVRLDDRPKYYRHTPYK